MSDNTEMIMMDSDEAATQMTITGWWSRHGRFYGNDERTARHDGCTHRKCERCGEPVEKSWLVCKRCRDEADIQKFKAMPRKAWDGKAMIYSELKDQYYSDPDEALEELAYCDGLTSEDLRLIICEPNYADELDSEYWCDSIPESGDIPDWLEDAIAQFNKAIADKEPLSWIPGKFALLLPPGK